MDDLLSAPDPEELHEQSFQRAAAPTWDGAVIKPLSARRLIAAQSCGLRVFKLASQRMEGEEEEIGIYDGILWDATIVVYLCSAPDSESLLAVRRPEVVSERALKWAEAQKLSPDSPRFAELIETFGRMIEDITSSATEPADDAGSAQKKMSQQSPGSPPSASPSAQSLAATSPTS